LAPVPRDSGRIRGNLHKPQRYNRSLRRVFYISAMVAANRPGESRDYYQRKRAESSRIVQAKIALARRRVNVRLGNSFASAPRNVRGCRVLRAAEQCFR
jgi:hypothetical protein